MPWHSSPTQHHIAARFEVDTASGVRIVACIAGTSHCAIEKAAADRDDCNVPPYCSGYLASGHHWLEPQPTSIVVVAVAAAAEVSCPVPFLVGDCHDPVGLGAFRPAV